MRIIKKIRFWFWWHFLATIEQKVRYDLIVKGVGIVKRGGWYVKPDKFLLDEVKSYHPSFGGGATPEMADALAYFIKWQPNQAVPTAPINSK